MSEAPAIVGASSSEEARRRQKKILKAYLGPIAPDHPLPASDVATLDAFFQKVHGSSNSGISMVISPIDGTVTGAELLMRQVAMYYILSFRRRVSFNVSIGGDIVNSVFDSNYLEDDGELDSNHSVEVLIIQTPVGVKHPIGNITNTITEYVQSRSLRRKHTLYLTSDSANQVNPGNLYFFRPGAEVLPIQVKLSAVTPVTGVQSPGYQSPGANSKPSSSSSYL